MTRTIRAFALLAAVLGVLFTGPALAQPRQPAELGGLRMPTHFAPECMAIRYSPVAVYESPGGLRIGKLVLDHPEYALKTLKSCSFRPKAQLEPEGSMNLQDVNVIEVGYEEPALAVYETRTHLGVLWVRGRTRMNTFWLPVAAGREYLSYERELVQGLESLSEMCEEPEGCKPVSDLKRKLAERAGAERADSCYGNAYDIEELVQTPSGRWAYRVRLAESLIPKYGGKLPQEAIVPTYDYRGRWTGFFLSRGC